jgi:hypothetical protein
MNLLFAFFRGWLGMYFLLAHFVVPFYLVAIYPDVPEPAVRAMRGLGYGVLEGPPSEFGFWYRFMACGFWVLLGMLILWHRIRTHEEPDGSASSRIDSKISRKMRGSR